LTVVLKAALRVVARVVYWADFLACQWVVLMGEFLVDKWAVDMAVKWAVKKVDETAENSVCAWDSQLVVRLAAVSVVLTADWKAFQPAVHLAERVVVVMADSMVAYWAVWTAE
jgi:hypothetical protein